MNSSKNSCYACKKKTTSRFVCSEHFFWEGGRGAVRSDLLSVYDSHLKNNFSMLWNLLLFVFCFSGGGCEMWGPAGCGFRNECGGEGRYLSIYVWSFTCECKQIFFGYIKIKANQCGGFTYIVRLQWSSSFKKKKHTVDKSALRPLWYFRFRRVLGLTSQSFYKLLICSLKCARGNTFTTHN